MLVGQRLNHPRIPPNEEPIEPFRVRSLLGVEIELEDCRLPVDGVTGASIGPKLWAIHTDNSLRNHGLEFVFKKPYGAQTTLKALKGLEEFFKEHKMRPDKSERTSVHVHVDARDVTEEQLFKWLVLYTVYEPLLFNVFAKGRINSNFCVPIWESRVSRWTIHQLKAVGLENFYQMICGQGEGYRYSALNLDALRKFGSLEFRHLKGEYKSKPLIDWIDALLCLKAWAVDESSSLDSFFSGPSKLYHKDLTQKIFSGHTSDRFFQHENYSKLFFLGLRTAQEIYLGATLPTPPNELKEKAQEIKLKQKKIAIEGAKELVTLIPQISDVNTSPDNEHSTSADDSLNLHSIANINALIWGRNPFAPPVVGDPTIANAVREVQLNSDSVTNFAEAIESLSMRELESIVEAYSILRDDLEYKLDLWREEDEREIFTAAVMELRRIQKNEWESSLTLVRQKLNLLFDRIDYLDSERADEEERNQRDRISEEEQDEF